MILFALERTTEYLLPILKLHPIYNRSSDTDLKAAPHFDARARRRSGMRG